MRSFAVAAALAVVGGLGFAQRADAQVIGTMGTPGASLGYYSPYPGALYSPFAPPPRITSGFYAVPAPGSFVAPNYYGNGFTITRTYSPYPSYFPRNGYSSFPGRGYRR